jgi:hypothetical protein
MYGGVRGRGLGAPSYSIAILLTIYEFPCVDLFIVWENLYSVDVVSYTIYY